MITVNEDISAIYVKDKMFTKIPTRFYKYPMLNGGILDKAGMIDEGVAINIYDDDFKGTDGAQWVYCSIRSSALCGFLPRNILTSGIVSHNCFGVELRPEKYALLNGEIRTSEPLNVYRYLGDKVHVNYVLGSGAKVEIYEGGGYLHSNSTFWYYINYNGKRGYCPVENVQLLSVCR